MINQQFHPLKCSFALITSLGLNSYSTQIVAQSNQPINNSANTILIHFNDKEPDGSSEGRPSGREGTGSRGDCAKVNLPLTALVPVKNSGLAVEEHPTFWFYVPYKSNEISSGEFSLQDEQNNDVYRTSFALPDKPGVVSFSLKAAAPLQINQKYHWYFILYCSQRESSNAIFVHGWVQRVTLKPELESLLKATNTPRERIALYAKNGIWHSALSELVKLRLAAPQDATFDNDWINLLKDIGLEKLVQKPIVGEVKIFTE